MSSELELCIRCDEPTGRAGRSEDSLYAGEVGPFCEDCWGEVPDEMYAELCTANSATASMRGENKRLLEEFTALHADRDALQAKLRHYEETVCLDDDLRMMHSDGCETKPVNTVKLGELFAKLAQVQSESERHAHNHDAALALLEEARRELDVLKFNQQVGSLSDPTGVRAGLRLRALESEVIALRRKLSPDALEDDSLRDLQAKLEAAERERMFPILTQRGAAAHPLKIPWSVAELAYSVYAGKFGKFQSLERLAERGGFGPDEMDEFVPDWRERCSELSALQAKLDEAKLKLGDRVDRHDRDGKELMRVRAKLAEAERERDEVNVRAEKYLRCRDEAIYDGRAKVGDMRVERNTERARADRADDLLRSFVTQTQHRDSLHGHVPISVLLELGDLVARTMTHLGFASPAPPKPDASGGWCGHEWNCYIGSNATASGFYCVKCGLTDDDPDAQQARGGG